jgi:hypothetical protein
VDKFHKCPKCQWTMLYDTNPCPGCKSYLEWSEESGPKLITSSNNQPDKAIVQPDKAAVKPVKKSMPVWAIALIVIIVLAIIGGLFVGVSNLWSNSSTSQTSTTAETTTFVGNESSKVFHYPSCHFVSELKSSNKVVFQSYSEAISKGYKPCGVCKPH